MINLKSISFYILAFFFSFTMLILRFDFENKRHIASEIDRIDLTCLKGTELEMAIYDRVISGFKGQRQNGLMGIRLGHFIYSEEKIENNESCLKSQARKISSTQYLESSTFACEKYPKIIIKFLADGEAANGEKRLLEIESPCEVSEDIGQTETFWVPWGKLSKGSPFDGTAEYTQPSKVKIRTQNIANKWPSKWFLDQIDLIGNNEAISIKSTQIKELAGRPIIFDFN
jgi:hypothetical protein